MRNLSEDRSRWMRVRMWVLATLLVAGGLRVTYEAYDLQVRRSDSLREMAEKQYLKELKLAPKRGTIVDRHGAELAVSVQVDSVWANPRQLRALGASPERVADSLSQLLGVDRSSVLRQLNADKLFRWIKRRISPAQGRAVAALQLPGVFTTQEARRFYPNGQLASHVLGFANVDGKGIEGLELSMDAFLRGAEGRAPAIRDRRGRVVFSQQLLDDRASTGDTVALTLDKTIQYLAEKELELAVRTFEAKAGSIVVMEPGTGELLAIANYPTFNPNRPGEAQPAHRRNRAVTDRFEPGSTVKPFTVAGALSAGAIRTSQSIDCEGGEMEIGEDTIHDSHKWDRLSPGQILAHSSNIGTAKIGLAMGRAGLFRTFRGFGFGAKAGLQLPGETAGILRHYKRWYELDAATISFGQGMSATALQLVTAMSALANGGKLMRPILVRRVQSPAGELLQETLPRVRRRVVPRRVARLVTDMLTGVTGEGGTAEEAAVDGYLVAGKTGTAQKADYVRGGYAKNAWSSSFVGYAPAHDPKLVVAVIVDEPLIAHQGGVVAAPVFRRLVGPALRHLGVPTRAGGSLVGHVRRRRREQRAQDKQDEAAARRIAADAVVAETDSPPRDVQGLVADGDDPGVVVPNLLGMTARAVLVAVSSADLALELEGSGFVDAQRPVADTKLPPGGTVRVHLSPRPERAGPTEAGPSASAEPAATAPVALAATGGSDG